MKPVPGKNAKPARSFTAISLKRLLMNPTYAGKVVLDGQEYEGAHEAIIGKDTWDTVQVLIAGRRTDPPRRRSKSEALLQGVVLCAACGSAMTAKYSKKKGRKYWYYTCMKLVKGGAAACPGSSVPARVIEANVVEQIRAIGRDPALLEEVVRQMECELEEKRPVLEARLREVESQHATFEAERNSLVGAVQGATGGKRAIFERLGVLQVELDASELQMGELREELGGLDDAVDREDLLTRLEEFDELWEELFPAERGRMLGLLLERVEYDARAEAVRVGFRAGDSP
jgi:site-specific DNA recombinase